MSSESPVWLSVSRNAFADGDSGPSVVGGVYGEKLIRSKRQKKRQYFAQDEVQGLRHLPRHLIQTIFTQAATDSDYTRYSIITVCKSWRDLALTTPALWSRIGISNYPNWYSSLTLRVLGNTGVIDYDACPTFRIRLDCVDSGQLVDLISKAPPERWESLHLVIGITGPSANMVYDLFCGRSFPKLQELRIEETGSNAMEGMGSLQRGFGDPYEPLYDCISFNTTQEFKTLYINADLLSTASQFGFFGQKVSSIGGSPQFIRDALLSSSGSSEWREASKLGANIAIRKYHYSHIVSLNLHTWDPDTIEKLSLPNLLYLRVDHCQLSDNQEYCNVEDCRPAILLPTVIKLTLTSHSLNVLAQVCTGSLENLVVEEIAGRMFDGCWPVPKAKPAPARHRQTGFAIDHHAIPGGNSQAIPANNRVAPLDLLGGSTSLNPTPYHLPSGSWTNEPPNWGPRNLWDNSAPVPAPYPTSQNQPWSGEDTVSEEEDRNPQASTSTVQEHERLFTLQADKWSSMYVDTVVLHIPVGIIPLVDFLRQSMALRKLVLTVPYNRPEEELTSWKQELVERLTDRSYVIPPGHRIPYRPFFCCPQLEELTLLMQGTYFEGAWEKELRQIMTQRGYQQETQDGVPPGRLRSIICRWKNDSRKIELVQSEQPVASKDSPSGKSTHEQPSEESTSDVRSPQAENPLDMEKDTDMSDTSDVESSFSQIQNGPVPSTSSEWETASNVSSLDPPETVNWSTSSEYEVVTGAETASSPSLASASLTEDSEDYDSAREGARRRVTNYNTDDEDW
ncbi:hypothetical protein FRC17_009453 [Serendipita sp. 399]|nr:hypothetical protein FRC17_009453 [Serendipita sp. 399]